MRPKVALALPLAVLACVSAVTTYGKPPRLLKVQDSEVSVIRASLGYSTLLEFQTPIVTAIIGDQDSFRVERVATGLAVKPLAAAARSNLFVTTSDGEFAFELVTVPRGECDYVVRVERPPLPKASVLQPSEAAVTALNRSAEFQGTRLTATSVTERADDLEIAFVIAGTVPRTFDAGDIAVLQGKRSLPIEHLYLEALQLSPAGVHGTVVLGKGKGVNRLTLVLAFTPDYLPTKAKRKLRIPLGDAKFPQKAKRPSHES